MQFYPRKSISFWFILFGLFACNNNLNANKTEKSIKDEINDLITPTKGTLEKVDDGFILEGKLKNSPQHLLILWEMTPQQLVFIYSARTDDEGNFKIIGHTKHDIFCQLQMGPQASVYMMLNNDSRLELDLSLVGNYVDYDIKGEELSDSRLLRKIVKANQSFMKDFDALRKEAEAIQKDGNGMQQAAVINSRYTRLMKQRNDFMLNTAMARKEGFIPYFIVAFGALDKPGYELIKHAVVCAEKANNKSKYAIEIKEKFQNEASLMIGGKAPEISLMSPDNKKITLSSLRGKIVMIDFWASWCGPCRRENPNVVRLYQQYKDKGFEIMGVSLDTDRNRWKAAIEADGLTWIHGSDLKGWRSAPAGLYQVHSIPQTFLLDAEGKIIAKGLRGEALAHKLEELIGSK